MKLHKYILNICTVYCILMMITSVIGSIQAFYCFRFMNKSHTDPEQSFQVNKSWFYLIYSLAIGLIFIRQMIGINIHSISSSYHCEDKVVFIVLYSYMIIVSDIILMSYSFCVANQHSGKCSIHYWNELLKKKLTKNRIILFFFSFYIIGLNVDEIIIYCTLLLRMVLSCCFTKIIQANYIY